MNQHSSTRKLIFFFYGVDSIHNTFMDPSYDSIVCIIWKEVLMWNNKAYNSRLDTVDIAKFLLHLLVDAISMLVFFYYLKNDSLVCALICLFVSPLSFSLCNYCLGYSSPCITLHKRLAVGAISFLFSSSVVLGFHIKITANPYNGTYLQNFITPYNGLDVIALCLITYYAYRCTTELFGFLQNSALHRTSRSIASIHYYPAPRRSFSFDGSFFLVAVVIMILWLRYFLVYYPGFIFGDSMHSILQAIGQEPLSNHHPIVYTLFVKICLDLGQTLAGSLTIGCAIYSVIQMIFLALGFSYIIHWITTRINCSHRISILIRAVCTLYFGLSSYIASYSIAMWKDPIFNMSLAILTLLLADCLISRGACTHQLKWKILFLLSSLCIVFLRSNGLAVAALVVCWILVCIVRRTALTGYTFIACALTILMACNCIITGPVYTSLGILPSENEEALGIPLNQMARVAATGAQMSDEDKQYLDSILPLDLYSDVYSPCCIDPIKWNDSFNSTPLHDNFLTHWVSMFIKNPITFFESWELQTFGFWTINQTSVLQLQSNIKAGDPQIEGSAEWANSAGIYPHSLIDFDVFDVEPSIDVHGIPIGIVFWCIVFLCYLLMLTNHNHVIIMFLPSFGTLLTLFLASPIWYWDRYGAVLHFLLPFYLFIAYQLLFYSGKSSEVYA